jgi:hypothetical protein
MRHKFTALGFLALLSFSLAACASSPTITNSSGGQTATSPSAPTPVTTLTPDPAWQYSRTFVATAFAKQSWDTLNSTGSQKWSLIFGEESQASTGLVYVEAKDVANKISVLIFGSAADSNVTQVMVIDSNPGRGPGLDIMDFAIGLMVNSNRVSDAQSRNHRNLEYDNGTSSDRQSKSVDDQESFGYTMLEWTARAPGNNPTAISLAIEPGLVTTTHSEGVAGQAPAASGQAGGFVLSVTDLVNYYTTPAQGFACEPGVIQFGFTLQRCFRTDAAGNTLSVGVFTAEGDQIVDVIAGVQSADKSRAVALDASDRTFLAALPEFLFGHSPIVVKITAALTRDLGTNEVGWSVSQHFSIETYFGDNHNLSRVWVEAVSQATANLNRPNVPFVGL